MGPDMIANRVFVATLLVAMGAVTAARAQEAV